MNWFKKLIPGASDGPLKNPHGLSGEFVVAIKEYIAPVAEVDAGLQQALLSYVIDGTNEQSLAKLRASKPARQKLGYEIIFIEVDLIKERQSKRRAMLKAEFEAPVEVWQRIGELFAAASSGSNIGAKAIPLPPDWPNWLLGIIRAVIDSYMAVYRNDFPEQWPIARLESFVAHAKLPEDALILPLLDKQYKNVFNSIYYYGQFIPPNAFADLGGYCSKHGESVASLLTEPSSDGGKHAIAFLSAIKYGGTPDLATLKRIADETAIIFPPPPDPDDEEGEEEQPE